MIAKLAGILEAVGAEGAVIDVGGVGYLAFCSSRTIGRLPPPGAAARLLIETHVREDHIHLYGFIDAAERDWFRLLLTVQGVGARLALALLSALSPEALALAVVAADRTALARAEGVGPRLAARIVNELRDKVGGLDAALPATGATAVAAVDENGDFRLVSSLILSRPAPGGPRLEAQQVGTKATDQEARDRLVSGFVAAIRQQNCDVYFRLGLTPTRDKLS